MTYFDRDSELTDAAVREILISMGTNDELSLDTPYGVELQTGKSTEIVSIVRKSDEDIEFRTTVKIIPVARLEVASLLKFVDDVITPRLFG